MNRNGEAEAARLDLVLNAIEEACESSQYVRFCEAFMPDCSALIQQQMPEAASTALQIAMGYRAGTVSRQSVSDIHAVCWDSLRTGHREMQLDDPNVAAIRAAICILHYQLHPESEEFVNLPSFFLRLLNTIEPHFREQEQLTRKHFADCLPL